MLPRPRRRPAPPGRQSHRRPRQHRQWVPQAATRRPLTGRARPPAHRTRPAATGPVPFIPGPRPLAAAIAATAVAVGVSAFAIAIHQPAAQFPSRGGPPWPRPADTAAGVRLAGLEMYPSAGAVTRYYLHLDVFVNGKHVLVPAKLGVDSGTSETASLHTWDSSGIVQIESNAESPRYTLGQLFDVWQVPLSATQVGGLHSGRHAALSAYVNGNAMHGDPRRIRLAPQQEITIEFGSGQPSPPSSYQFPPGG